MPAAPDLAGDFTAEVAFTLGERVYAATYTRSGATKTVAFTAPDTLCGMTAAMGEDGALTVKIGDLVYAAQAADGMLDFTRLWDVPADTLRFAGEEGGVRCFTASGAGTRSTVYTDQNGLPIRMAGAVDGREYDLQILRYERRDGR